jgi:peptidoglycan/LPS O-acetylase OafA/YrhL
MHGRSETAPVPSPQDHPHDERIQREHFPALDGCRALAAFGVILTHVGLLSGYSFRNPAAGQYFARADVGVSIFFVLSGFLLYRPFVVRRLAGRGLGDLRRYTRRRLLRILPAYWVALTVVAYVLRAPGFDEGHDVISRYLLLHVYDIHQIPGPIDQSWSLATELSFYLFLPMWAWAMARGDRTPERQLRVEVLGLGLLWTACIALNLWVISRGVTGQRFGQLGTWLPFRVHEFVVGMGLAVASAWLRHRRLQLPERWSGTPLALGSWLLAALVFWGVSSQLGFPTNLDFTPNQALGLRLLYSVIGLLVVLPAVLGRQDRGLAQTLLANRVAVWFGLISYGLYIWHKAWQYKYLDWADQVPLGANFRSMLLVTVSLSIVVAAASWYLVERPLTRGRALRRAARQVPPGSR